MRLFLKQFVKTINEQSENNIYRSSHRRCSIKNVFLKMSQNSKYFFFLQFYYKRDSDTSVFSVTFAKFLRTTILKDICERLLLYLIKQLYKTDKIKIQSDIYNWLVVITLSQHFAKFQKNLYLFVFRQSRFEAVFPHISE